MKTNLRTHFFIGICLFSLSACQESDAIKPSAPVPSQVTSFLNSVNNNPLMISGKPIKDSWRVVHKKYHYHDGVDMNGNDLIKAFDLNMMTNPLPVNTDFERDYRENWILGRDSVMFIYNGSLKDGKLLTNAFEKFKMHVNTPVDQNSPFVLTIDYVYDSKAYSKAWTVTFNNDNEIVLTIQDLATDYLFQYTLRKEAL